MANKPSYFLRALALSSALVGLSACETTNSIRTLSAQGNNVGFRVERPERQTQDELENKTSEDSVEKSTPLSEIKAVPSIAELQREGHSKVSTRAPKIPVKTVEAYVAPSPLPEFIDVAFGEMLKVPYVTGPGVAARKDVVQLRSSGTLSGKDFFDLVQSALREYGVRVVPENGVYRILEDQALKARMPRYIRSRAQPGTPKSLRPVIQLVELYAVDANSMVGLLKQAVGGSKNVKITAQPLKNTITLSGLPDEVDAILSIIKELDELNYAGSTVQRYSPVYWEAKALAKEVGKILSVEGWQVTNNIMAPRAINLLPVEYSNDIFIFSRNKTVSERTNIWLKELDRPIKGGDSSQLFIYQVANVDAIDLAETANAAMNAGSVNRGAGRPGSGTAAPSTGDASGRKARKSSPGDKFVVDPIGNRLIFSGTVNEYERVLPLLKQLDRPPAEVLIEVTIAEVTLNDSTKFGLEFFINDIGANNFKNTFGTQGLGVGSTGFNVAIAKGDVTLNANTLATNSDIKVLSTPRLMARSGGSANITVGTDVPVITSQRAANSQSTSGVTDVLQTVSYRKTGVILNIEPIVFSNNRVDLTISQEVSATIDSGNSAIASPTISNRSLETQLSLEDGQTAVLGGLMQDTLTHKETGIPFLKDIPLIGSAFSSDTITSDRTELLVLITAYIMRGQEDKTAFVDSLTKEINGSLSKSDRLITLLPRNSLLSIGKKESTAD
ncbi:MAG: secretin N-terminal domain-containing protein [Robiginitomaculum sp.]|nr:secretin N-terminal domain-containing protein [Robiginitomaculum sp.]